MDADGRRFGFNHLFSLMGTDISELRKNFDDRRCDQKALQQRFSDRNPTASTPYGVCCAAAQFFKSISAYKCTSVFKNGLVVGNAPAALPADKMRGNL